MQSEVVINSRFCGPPNSGHGGYSCGIVGMHIDGPAEVTLKVPPPLNTPLNLHREEDGSVVLRNREQIVAEGLTTELDLEIPDAPTFAQAEQAARNFPFYTDHVFPTCFGCGPDRKPDDGLCLFSGRVDGADIFAAPWTPHSSLVGADGQLGEEMVWAALDCATGFAIIEKSQEVFPEQQFILLGKFAVRVNSHPTPGDNIVVLSWPVGQDGRKFIGGAALISASGATLAVARGTWVVVLPKQ